MLQKGDALVNQPLIQQHNLQQHNIAAYNRRLMVKSTDAGIVAFPAVVETRNGTSPACCRQNRHPGFRNLLPFWFQSDFCETGGRVDPLVCLQMLLLEGPLERQEA